MVCNWHKSDIRGGLIIGRPNLNERWVIGFLAQINDECKYVTVSCVDGMVTKMRTKEELALMLTKDKYIPAELLDSN